jgi:hypothetical protein
VPVRLVVAALIVLALSVAGRKWVALALRDAGRGTARHLRSAGPVHLAALVVIVVAGTWLRFHYLDVPMRWDESYTFIGFAARRLSVGLSESNLNNHPLNTLLMHIVYLLGGPGHRVIRSPVLIAGILLPPAAYVAAARLHGRAAALVVAALLAGSAQATEFSTNARGYELAMLAAVLLIALVPSLSRSANPTYWGLFALIAALGLYTQPVFFYALGPIVAALAVGGWFGYSEHERKRFLLMLAAAFASAVAFAALLYGPIVDDVIRQSSKPGYTHDPAGLGKELWRVWTLGLPLPAKIVLVLGFVVSAVAVWQRPIRRFPLAVALLVCMAAVVALGRVLPYARYFVPLLPLVLILCVGGLIGSEPARRMLTRPLSGVVVSAAAVAIALALVHVVSRNNLADQDASALPDANLIAGVVGPRLKSGDELLVSSTGWPIEAYTFLTLGWSRYYVVGSVSREQAARGTTYVVVNTWVGETLHSVLAQAAAGSGLEARGTQLARFAHAAVYELRRPAA